MRSKHYQIDYMPSQSCFYKTLMISFLLSVVGLCHEKLICQEYCGIGLIMPVLGKGYVFING